MWAEYMEFNHVLSVHFKSAVLKLSQKMPCVMAMELGLAYMLTSMFM